MFMYVGVGNREIVQGPQGHDAWQKTGRSFISSCHQITYSLLTCGDSSDKHAPTSFTNPTATSTPSSEGVSKSSISISRAMSSCATCQPHNGQFGISRTTVT